MGMGCAHLRETAADSRKRFSDAGALMTPMEVLMVFSHVLSS
jgi:hypothetical protein